MSWSFRVMGECCFRQRSANENVLRQEESWQFKVQRKGERARVGEW